MGDRAQYVIKDGGSWERYYSQWAGYSMELDMLPGPGPASRFAGGQRRHAAWMNEAECTGAALIDRDERRLLWYSRRLDDVAYRAAVLDVMARTWAGWRLDWAYGGLGQIVGAVGEDGRQVRRPRTLPVPDDLRTPEEFMAAMPQFRLDPRTCPPGQVLPGELLLGTPELRQATDSAWPCLVTVAREGEVRAYMVDGRATGVIESGAGSLERHYQAWSPVTTWPHFPAAGVHLDVDARAGGAWTSGSLDQALEGAGASWPGWRWESWQDRYGEQFDRAAGAITLPEPDRALGLRSLVDKFESHRELDAGTQALSLLLEGIGELKAVAESAGMSVETVTDNGFSHRPMDLSAEECARVQAAFAAALGEL